LVTSLLLLLWITRHLQKLKSAEEKKSESDDRYRSLLENMLNGFAYCQMIFEDDRPADFIYLDVNRAFESLTGMKNVTGERVSEAVPGIRESDPHLIEIYGRVATTGNPETFEMFVESLNDWYAVSVYSPERSYFIAVFDVITKRKKAQDELQLVTERLKLAARSANMGIWDWDIPSDTLFWDNQMYRLYGIDEVASTGAYDTWLNGVHPDDREKTDTLTRQVLQGKGEYITEFRVLWQDGSVHWIKANGQVFFSEPGEPRRMIGVNYDISERKQAAEALLESKIQLEAALASMTDAISISDVEGDFIQFNEAFATFHKFRNKEECAKTLAEYPLFLEVNLANGELAPLEQWAVPRALRGEIVKNAEYGLRRTDTGESWVGSYSFAPIRDNHGAIVGSVVAGRDISEMKQAEITLLETNNRLRIILENNPIAIWDWNIKSDSWYATPKYFTLLGYAPDSSLQDHRVWLNGIHPDDSQQVETMMKNLLLQVDEIFSFDARYQHADGTYVWQQVNGQVVERDDQGKAQRLLGIRMDINENKLKKFRIMEHVDELNRWYKATIDREDRVMELKQEVNQLLAKQGEAARYQSQIP